VWGRNRLTEWGQVRLLKTADGAHPRRGVGPTVATRAFAAGEGLESARCRTYVNEFRKRLYRHRQCSAVRDFVTGVRDFALWTSP
jgi:hypothetical protein